MRAEQGTPPPYLRTRAERGDLALAPSEYGVTRTGLPLHVFLPPEGVVARRLIFAGIHGHEPDTTAVTSAALRSIDHTALRCAVVLAANPEGLLRGTRGNAAGVELNRNWPSTSWQPGPVAHRWTEAEQQDVLLSPGPEPGSEPEVQALISLIGDLAPQEIVSVHSPLGCIDDPRQLPLGGWLAEHTGLERVAGVGYPTPGSFGTWAREQDLPTITYELPIQGISDLIASQSSAVARLLVGDCP